MLQPIIIGALAGVAAAQAAGPICLGWPGRTTELLARVGALTSRGPGRTAKAIGASLIGLVLVGGALTAYAAAPAAPRRMVAQVVKLAGLEVRDAFNGERPTSPPARAPLRMQAPWPEPPLSNEDARLIARAIATSHWDGVTPQHGLTLAETKRYALLGQKMDEAGDAARAEVTARAEKAGITGVAAALDGWDMPLSLLGADAPEYARLANKMTLAGFRDQQATYARYGAVTVHIPPPAPGDSGPARLRILSMTAGFGPASWTISNRQPDGSFDETMTAPGDPLLFSSEVAANPPPLHISTFTVSSEGKITPVTLPPGDEAPQG